MIKKQKISICLSKMVENNSIFYLVPLILLSVPLLASGKPYPAGYYLIHYLYTYDHGFIPRGLLGEVISWFTDTVSKEQISDIAFIFSVLLVISSCLCIGKVLSKLKAEKENFICVMLIIILLSVFPTTFSMQFQAFHLDKILWALTLFAVYISNNRIGIWFVPLLCIISTLINPYYVLGSMLLIAIILLQKFLTSGYSKINGFICVITYSAIITIVLYGIMAEAETGFKNANEMTDYYFSRYTGELSQETYDGFCNRWLFDYFEKPAKVLELSFKYYFVESSWGVLSLIYFLCVALPFWIFMGWLWIKAIKKEQNKFQKFIYFLCFISPVTIIPVELLGWELPRYFADSLIVELCLVAYFIAHKHLAVEETVKEFVGFLKSNILFSVAIILYTAFLLAY